MFPKPERKPKQRDRRKEEQAIYTELLKPAYLHGLARGQRRLQPLCEGCGRQEAVEIHHKRGREGFALLDATHFMGLCADCHRVVHDNPAAAYEKGWLVRRNGVE